jgi:hypothetical protein
VPRHRSASSPQPPSFSREDESIVSRVLDRLSRVFGHLPFAAMLKVIGSAVKGGLPSDRHDALVAELRRNDPRVVRRHVRLFHRAQPQGRT